MFLLLLAVYPMVLRRFAAQNSGGWRLAVLVQVIEKKQQENAQRRQIGSFLGNEQLQSL
jgi:hypothetical protein